MSAGNSDLEAVVFLPPACHSAAVLKVAGLPLLQRTWRILRRSGFRKVLLVTSERDPRSSQWASEAGLECRVVTRWKPSLSMALLISADLALEHDYLRRFLSRCESGQTEISQPCSWVAAGCGSPPRLMLLRGTRSGNFADLSEVERAGPRGPLPRQRVEVAAVCLRITDRQSARLFHRRIEERMIKPTDGLFARWNRKISLPLSRLLVHTPLTPNGITYLTLLVGAAAGFLLSRGAYLEMLLGAVLVQASSILDGNDGELARLKIEDSDYGTWLDTVCDYISYFLTFGGIGYGLYRSSDNSLYLQMTGIMFAGFAAAMILTSRLRSRYTGGAGASALTSLVVESLDRNRKEDLWASLSHRFRHFGTRATFSYCILLLGIVNGWQIIFWTTVAGAQIYWMAVLYSERFVRQRELR